MPRQPLHPKIQVVTKALESMADNPKYIMESWSMLSAAIGSLTAKEVQTQPDAELNITIAVYLTGGLIAAIAIHQEINSRIPALCVVSTDPGNEFYLKSFYPLSWSQLKKGIPNEPLAAAEVIKKIGMDVLAKKIPFEQKKLTFLFPILKVHFEVVDKMLLGQAADMPSGVKTTDNKISNAPTGVNKTTDNESLAVPSGDKPTYNKSLAEIKEKISAFFKPYYDNYKFHLFGYGPHHKTRAKQVLAAVQAAQDVDTIVAIIENQENVMFGISSLDAAIRLKNTVGLEPRWTTSANLKNKAKSVKYSEILSESSKFIESCVSNKEDIYTQVLSPHGM
jgi:hypothetical protein